MERCNAKVSADSWGFRRCMRAAVRDGMCRQHHPDSEKGRREKSEADREQLRVVERHRRAEDGLKLATNQQLLAELTRRLTADERDG